MSEDEAVRLLLSLGYTLSKPVQPFSTPLQWWTTVCPLCGWKGGHGGLPCPQLDPKSTPGVPL